MSGTPQQFHAHSIPTAEFAESRPCPYLSLSLTYLAAIFLAACPASPACVPSLILGPPTCTCSTLQVIAGCRCEDVTSTRYKESRSHCPEWMCEQQASCECPIIASKHCYQRRGDPHRGNPCARKKLSISFALRSILLQQLGMRVSSNRKSKMSEILAKVARV